MASLRAALIWTLSVLLLLLSALFYIGDFNEQPLYTSATWSSLTSWEWISGDNTASTGDAGILEAQNGAAEYMIGAGKADITGPVVEINLMGYADPSQTGTGLRQRLYSRSFIVGSTSDPSSRIVYLVLDTQSGDTAIRHGILERLRNMGSEYAVYTKDNVAVTGTHSHSGPGAWLNYLLPQITSKGFSKESYEAIVSGAVLSITRAHKSLAKGSITVAAGEVEDGNINRSLYAYLANPQDERDQYKDSVDKTMTVMRMSRSEDGKDIGLLTWFAVHGTSMLGNNTLITGDNKGVAADLLERAMHSSLSSEYVDENFVAGFSQANVGDTSPNVLSAYCEDPELPPNTPCDFRTSLCNNKTQTCHGRGPYYGRDDAGTDSCFEIGRRQYLAAKRIYDDMRKSRVSLLQGPVTSLHAYHDLSNFTFPLTNGTLVNTCPAALGYSFAAGTTDGPGAFDFSQNDPGEPSANPLWAAVRNLIHKPSEDVQACHAPKPILLDVGETKKPYDWAPNIVDIQLLRIGNLIMIISPGEATTMSGRRWRSAVQHKASRLLGNGAASTADVKVVLGGPANSYTHYIATREEYGIQRYEGASTLYGPHTLDAYIHLTTGYLPHLLGNPSSRPDAGPRPPVNTNRSWSFITDVIFDSPGIDPNPFHDSPKYGDVVDDVQTVYRRGEVVTAAFRAANPRNNLRLEGSYARVQRRLRSSTAGSSSSGSYEPDQDLRHRQGRQRTDGSNTETAQGQVATADEWEAHRDDANWDLTLQWERTSTLLGTSKATISWAVPTRERLMYEYGDEGLAEEFWQREIGNWEYRIAYYGDAKSMGGGVEAFEGTSGVFTIED